MKMDPKKLKYMRVVWCLLALWLCWQLGAVATGSTLLPRRVRKALAHYKESLEKDKPVESADNKQPPAKSMFARPKKATKPTCVAILGDEALINGKWHKVGSEVSGAKIAAINPDSVTIIWEGKEQMLVPFDVKVQYEGKSDKQQAAPAPSKRPPQEAERPEGGGFPEGRPGGPRGMASDRRRAMYERYQNASPEEQEKMRQRMRERSGGRRRGDRGESDGNQNN